MKQVFLGAAFILSIGAFVIVKSQSKAEKAETISKLNQNEKVTICHRTGNGSSHPITVSINAVPAHMAHGDAIGDCSDGGELPTR